MTNIATLGYYACHRAALFPMPAGAKAPIGIVASWQRDHSADPAQWARWRVENPGCNFGVVASASRLVIVDVDVSEVGRDAAWAAWVDWCASHRISDPPSPHVQSARGGWHFYFALPAGVDPATLTQRRLADHIDTRVEGFTVAAGSHYLGAPYVLLSDAPPHPAPAPLLAALTRATPARPSAALVTGTRDPGDVAALIRWLADRDGFTAYDDWFQLGMALKVEFGDAGLDLWRLSHDATVTADIEQSKWASFDANPTGQSVTLATFLAKAHAAGWRGSVRKSTAALFDGVAAIAHAAGAALPGQAAPLPMVAGQAVLTEHAAPILTDFLTATTDAPLRPNSTDYPDIPASLVEHGLYGALRDVVARVMAMAESGAKMARTVDALAVLQLVHVDTYDAIERRCTALGAPLPSRKIKLAASALSDRVERAFVKNDDWIYDAKGIPEANNSDNVTVFLGITCTEIRWNAWLERAEIRGFDGLYGEWTMIDDSIVAKMRTRGNRTKTRFVPAKEFFWESLLALAAENTVDPALEALAAAQKAWDGVPRLSIWLARACGVPCDPYHQAVARNIIGGMVRRIRQPGCKHDFMPVFFGPQGNLKSTMAATIALDPAWFSDDVLLGDASKELVLSLAGKCVVEIGEMGMRGSANPNHVKAMLSRQVDRGRTAYARTVSERPRRNIFIGTTNDEDPLVDPTGNRRFLPVRVTGEIDIAWLHANIGQLIGEAATAEAAGADFALPREVWAAAAEHQEAARSGSDIETMLTEWFAPTERTAALSYITASDLVTLSIAAGWRSNGAHSARGAIMKRLRFRIENLTVDGKRTRAWVRGAEVRPAEIVRDGVRYMVGGDPGRPVVRLGMASVPK